MSETPEQGQSEWDTISYNSTRERGDSDSVGENVQCGGERANKLERGWKAGEGERARRMTRRDNGSERRHRPLELPERLVVGGIACSRGDVLEVLQGSELAT